MRRDHQFFFLTLFGALPKAHWKWWPQALGGRVMCSFLLWILSTNFGNSWAEMEIGICLVRFCEHQRWLFSQKKSGMEERGGGSVWGMVGLYWTGRRSYRPTGPFYCVCCVVSVDCAFISDRAGSSWTPSRTLQWRLLRTHCSRNDMDTSTRSAFVIQIHHTCLTWRKDLSPCWLLNQFRFPATVCRVPLHHVLISIHMICLQYIIWYITQYNINSW